MKDKFYFSKPNCVVEKLVKEYSIGYPLHQDYLETALKQIIARVEMKIVENYKSKHHHDKMQVS